MTEQSEQEKPQLLIADDSKVIRKSISKMLSAEYTVIEAADGQEALEILQENDEIRLVFSDLGMPRMDGYELLAAIRASEDEGLAELPVIIVTGKEDTEEAKEKMIELGATDLIGKPFHSAELKSRTRSYINLTRKVKKLEEASPVDKHTGLATRDYFNKQADITFALAKRHDHEITLARINIENYQDLESEYGHNMMPRIIATVGKLMQGDMRKEDLGVHLGEDKFALMLPCADPDGANEAMKRIRQRLEKVNLKIGEHVVHIAFSAGIVSHVPSEKIAEFSHLVDEAEEALKQALDSGKEQTVTISDDESLPEPETVEIDIQIDALVAQLHAKEGELSDEHLLLAMKKFLPLMARADQRLRLGLGRVVLHLHKKLK